MSGVLVIITSAEICCWTGFVTCDIVFVLVLYAFCIGMMLHACLFMCVLAQEQNGRLRLVYHPCR